MQLDGWSSYQMVLRYAHLALDHPAAVGPRRATAFGREKRI